MADWLTKREAADYLKISLRHLSRLPIPRSLVGRNPRYSREAIDEWLEGLSQTPQGKPKAGRRAAPRLAAADWPTRLARMKADLIRPRRA